MNNHELTHAVETAMDLIIDGRPDAALASLWCLHRAIREVTMIDVPNDQPRIYADEITGVARGLLMAEARASVALDGQTYSLDGPLPSAHRYEDAKKEERLAKDRARKQRDRERAKENYWKNKEAVAKEIDENLPPMKPINGRVQPVKAREIRCLTCGAKPDQPCTGFTTAGKWGKPTGEPIKTYHTKRVRTAQKMTEERQDKAMQKLIDQAAEASNA